MEETMAAKKKTANKAAQTETKEKIVTRYDRKVQRRKEEARRAAREKLIAKIVLIALLAAVVIGGCVAGALKINSIYNCYIVVDGEKISEIEFDFYYGMTKTSNMNTALYGTMTYGDYYESYLGYDSTKSDKKQTYSDDVTWFEYFATDTVDSLKELKALLNDAEANEYDYADEETDYEEFISELQSSAETEGVSYEDYLKEIFGSRATEERLESSIKDYLKAIAYQEKLDEDLAATEEEITEYYEENKDSYDLFDYRQFEITADSTDTADMETAKAKADEFAEAVTSEASFAALCMEYSAEDDETYLEESASLISDTKQSSMDSVCADWLISSERNEGDVTVIEDSTNGCYYILYYIERTYEGDDDDTIAEILLSEKYSEYISDSIDAISVDVKGHFTYED